MILFFPVILGSIYLLITRRRYSIDDLYILSILLFLCGLVFGLFLNAMVDINIFRPEIEESNHVIENIEGIPGGVTYIELESGNNWTIDNSALETNINPDSENPTDFNCFTVTEDKSPSFIWYMGIHERSDREFHITNSPKDECLKEGAM